MNNFYFDFKFNIQVMLLACDVLCLKLLQHQRFHSMLIRLMSLVLWYNNHRFQFNQ